MFPFALTIHQPHANEIFAGTKTEELRQWRPVPYIAWGVFGKPLLPPFALLIHAGSRKRAHQGAKGPYSCYLGVALFDTITHAPGGNYAWHIAQTYSFKRPVPGTGNPSLWRPPLPVRVSILAAIDASPAAWLIDYFPKQPCPASTGQALPDELPLELEAAAQWSMSPLFA